MRQEAVSAFAKKARDRWVSESEANRDGSPSTDVG